MPGKMTDEEKAEAVKEYVAERDSAIARIETLKAARLARDAAMKKKAAT